MEDEIERTIRELLKESEDIKQAAILKGAPPDAEPPVYFVYTYVTDVLCSKSLEAITKMINDTEKKDLSCIVDLFLKELAKSEKFDDDLRRFFAEYCKRAAESSEDAPAGDPVKSEVTLQVSRNDCSDGGASKHSTNFASEDDKVASNELNNLSSDLNCTGPTKVEDGEETADILSTVPDCIGDDCASENKAARLFQEFLRLHSHLSDEIQEIEEEESGFASICNMFAEHQCQFEDGVNENAPVIHRKVC